MNKSWLPSLACALVAGTTALAQPVIRSRNPVVNAASYRTPGLPASGIAQGSMFTIFGTGLGPDEYAAAYSLPLPTELGKTSVSVTVGGTSVSAFILFTYRSQINAILPSSTPLGNGTVAVTYSGVTSAPAPIQVVSGAFGIYTFSSSGSGQAIATHTDYQLNTIIRTFHPGDAAILWGTGLGAIDARDDGLPPTGNLPGSVKVYAGNKAATVSYHGRSGCCAGLDQIVFQIPEGLQGCHVPIGVDTGGGVSNIATIAVSASGRTCSDSVMGQDLVDSLADGKKVKFGYVRLESLIAPVGGGQAGFASTDYGLATFSEYTPDTAGLAEYGVSAGYCITVDCSYGCGIKGALSLSDSGLAWSDAGGELSIRGPSSGSISRVVPYQGFYMSPLNTSSRFLWSGLAYTVSGAGAAGGVGQFSADIRTSLADVHLAGIKGSQTLPLSGDLTVEWTGGKTSLQSRQVTIGGYSGNDDLTQFVLLQCSAPVDSKKFTIPAWVLSTMPPSGEGHAGSGGSITYPQGWLWIGQYNNPVAFQADNLDRGILTDAFFNGFAIYYK